MMTDKETIENLKCVIADISEQCEELKAEKTLEAEHRAEVAEMALELMARGECTFASPEYYKEQAEKELAEVEDEE